MCIKIQIKVCIFQDESILNLIYVTISAVQSKRTVN